MTKRILFSLLFLLPQLGLALTDAEIDRKIEKIKKTYFRLEQSEKTFKDRFKKQVKDFEARKTRVDIVPNVTQGRLTLTSDTPVTTGAVDIATTLYFARYGGKFVSIYYKSAWRLYQFNNISLDVSGFTNDTNYDIWIYSDLGVATLDATAWASDNARATALTTQDGVLVKSGDAERKYLGTIRMNNNGTTTGISDTIDYNTGTTGLVSRRYVWNYYNRIKRVLRRFSTGNYAANSFACRQANSDTTNAVSFVIGVAEVPVKSAVQQGAGNAVSSPTQVSCGIGINSTTTNDSDLKGGTAVNLGNNGRTQMNGYSFGFPTDGSSNTVGLFNINKIECHQNTANSVTYEQSGGVAIGGMIVEIEG